MYIHTQIDLAQFAYFSPQKTLGPFIKHVNKFLDIFYALVLKHGFLDDLPPPKNPCGFLKYLPHIAIFFDFLCEF